MMDDLVTVELVMNEYCLKPGPTDSLAEWNIVELLCEKNYILWETIHYRYVYLRLCFTEYFFFYVYGNHISVFCNRFFWRYFGFGKYYDFWKYFNVLEYFGFWIYSGLWEYFGFWNISVFGNISLFGNEKFFFLSCMEIVELNRSCS